MLTNTTICHKITDMQNTDFNPQDVMNMVSSMLDRGVVIAYTKHATERMKQRGITPNDVWYLLTHGRCDYIRTMGQNKRWKYNIYVRRGNDIMTAVTIPSERGGIKIVTVYWNDKGG